MTDPTAPSLELGTGFRDDEVTVLLDGREVWHGQGVSTNYSVGLAAIVPLPAGGETLEVHVGSRAAGAARLADAAAESGRLRVDLDPAGAMAIAPAPEGPVF